MDIGVADDSLNGIPFEESSESEEEEEIDESEGINRNNIEKKKSLKYGPSIRHSSCMLKLWPTFITLLSQRKDISKRTLLA